MFEDFSVEFNFFSTSEFFN